MPKRPLPPGPTSLRKEKVKSDKADHEVEADSDVRMFNRFNQPLGMMARTVSRIKAAKNKE